MEKKYFDSMSGKASISQIKMKEMVDMGTDINLWATSKTDVAVYIEYDDTRSYALYSVLSDVRNRELKFRIPTINQDYVMHDENHVTSVVSLDIIHALHYNYSHKVWVKGVVTLENYSGKGYPERVYRGSTIGLSGVTLTEDEFIGLSKEELVDLEKTKDVYIIKEWEQEVSELIPRSWFLFLIRCVRDIGIKDAVLNWEFYH